MTTDFSALRKSKSEEHIAWIDVLRMLAIMGVILCHVVDTFMATPEVSGDKGCTLWIELFKALSRPSVPLFVMITGFLLLPVKTDSVTFYKKRLSRILLPFLFWSVVYSMLPWILHVCTRSDAWVHLFFPYYDLASVSFSETVSQIARIPFTFNNATYPLWYVYMLVGLYLFIPVLSPWLERSSSKEKTVFLVMWVISLFVPYIRAFFMPYVFGEAAWNEFGMFYYFAGFSGYLLVGYWMKSARRYPLRGKCWITLPLFAAAYLLTYIGYHSIMASPEVTEEEMELFFLFCTPNVMVMTVLLFIIFSGRDIASLRVKKVLDTLSRCGFGIYMVHYLFVGPVDYLAHCCKFPAVLHIPFCTAAVFLLSWLFVYTLTFLPKHKWITG